MCDSAAGRSAARFPSLVCGTRILSQEAVIGVRQESDQLLPMSLFANLKQGILLQKQEKAI